VEPRQENTPHELYVRTIKGKKAGPLKLSGSVTGSFNVQRAVAARDLVASNSETSKWKEMRREEEEKREKGRIKLIDSPLDVPSATTTKRKRAPGSGTVLHKSRPNNEVASTASSLAQSRITSPLPSRATPPVSSQRDNTDVKQRIIRFLAREPNSSTDDVLARVGGKTASAEIKDAILSVLPEVCSTYLLVPKP
jgi:hypothetical protein